MNYKHMKAFYKRAYMDGYNAKNVCGSLGKLDEPSDTQVTVALVLALKATTPAQVSKDEYAHIPDLLKPHPSGRIEHG